MNAYRQVYDALQEIAERRRHDEAQRQRRQTRRRRIVLLSLLSVGLVSVGGWQLYQLAQNIARYRVAVRFVRAVESEDGATLCQLVTPETRRELHLTPTQARAVVRWLFAGLTPIERADVQRSTPSPYDAFPEERSFYIDWRNAATKQPILTWGGTRKLRSRLAVKPTSEGFRVDFNVFVGSTALSRWGDIEGKHRFGMIRRRLMSSDPLSLTTSPTTP